MVEWDGGRSPHTKDGVWMGAGPADLESTPPPLIGYGQSAVWVVRVLLMNGRRVRSQTLWVRMGPN